MCGIAGFSGDFDEALLDHMNAAIAQRGLFDPQGVQRMIELDRKRKLDASYTIFSLIRIELWCRMFIDQRTPAVV